MGQYAVRCYKSTGFDGVNIPDSLDLLNQFAYKDYGSVDLRQERFLSYIRLNDTWANVSDYDYVKIGTDANAFYYSCTPTMIADDVVELTLLPDWILSAGGIEKALAMVIGGMTTRFIPTNDALGYYEESDALLAPALPLNIQQNWFNPGGSENYTLIESTVDIPETYAKDTALYCSDEESGEGVTIPAIQYINSGTEYSLSGLDASSNPVTRLYNYRDTATASPSSGSVIPVYATLRYGVAKLRTIGVEDSVKQFLIPQALVTPTYSSVSLCARTTGTPSGSDRYITKMTGNTGSFTTGINYDYTSQGSDIVWQRILTSEYTKYGIVTASGESCEFNPAEILETGSPTSPSVRWIADPRPDGKPYFRFKEVNSDASTGANFFRSSVSGLNWKQVSMLFTGVSGSALNTLAYQNSRKVADTNYENSMAMLNLEQEQRGQTRVFNQANNIASGIGGVIGSALSGDIGGAVQRGINAGFAVAGTELQYSQETEMNSLSIANQTALYQAQKNQELSALAVQNSIAVPTVTIPYNSELIRDFYGNGCLVYRYVYDGVDIARINKILSMYGYKHTKPVVASDYFNHQNFDYVECKGLSVTGLPKYWCNGLSAQLNNGVRVWHVKPHPKYYENKGQNPNK